MRVQILVAIGALLFNFVHPSRTNPLHHTNTGLDTIKSHGTANDTLPTLECLFKREEWLANLGNGWASYVQTWDSFLRTHIRAPNFCYRVVFGGTEQVSEASAQKTLKA